MRYFISILLILMPLLSYGQSCKKYYDSAAYCLESGRYPLGIEIAKKALSSAEAELAENDTNYLKIITVTHRLFDYSRNMEKALEYGRLDSTLRAKYQGVDHPDYACTIRNLAETYRDLDSLELAEELAINSIEVLRKTTGTDNIEYAKALNIRGLISKDKKNFKLADSLFEKAISICERNDFEDERICSYFYSNLSNVRERFGYQESAGELLRKAYEMLDAPDCRDYRFYPGLCGQLASYYSRHIYNKKAEPLFEKALKLMKEKFGEGYRGYSTILSNYGVNLYHAGKFKKAEQIFLKVLELCKKYGYTDKYIESEFVISTFYFEKQEYGKAEEHLLNNIRLQEDRDKDYSYYYSHVYLGRVYGKYEDFSNAEIFIKKGLKGIEKIFGKESKQFILYYIDLAELYNESKDFKKSENIYKEIVNIAERVWGKEEIKYGSYLSHLANFYHDNARYFDALSCHLEAAEVIINSKGKESYSYAIHLRNISIIYHELGNYSKAEDYALKSIETIKKIRGNEHPQYAASLNYYTNILLSKGEYNKAFEIRKQIVEIIRKKFGRMHSRYAFNLNKLAKLYMVFGRYEEAEKYLLQAKDVAEEQACKRCYYLTVAQNAADFYMTTGKYNEAEKYISECIDISKKMKGGWHPFYASAIERAARNNYYQKNYQKAEEYAHEAMRIRERIDGIESREYAGCMQIIALIKSGQGKKAEAEQTFQRALEINEKNLGINHPVVAENIMDLADFYYRNGSLKSAEPFFQKAAEITLNLIQRYFPYLSEQHKLDYWAGHKKFVDLFNNFAIDYHKSNPEFLRHMYDLNIAVKGLIVSSQKAAMENARNNPELYENWRNTREIWVNLVQNPEKAKKMGIDIDSLEQAAVEFEIEISKSSAQFKKEFSKNKVSWRDIQQRLKNNEASVEIIRFNNSEYGTYDSVRYAALILKKNSRYPELVLTDKVSSDEKELLQQYRNVVNEQITGVYDSKEINDVLKKMYAAFWSGIQRQLEGTDVVYLSKDGVFHQININTLIDPGSGKYVIDIADIRPLSDTKDLLKQFYGKDKKKSAVLAGAPDFYEEYAAHSDAAGDRKSILKSEKTLLSRDLNSEMRLGIDPLPASKLEVEEISAKMKEKGWDIELFTGPRACEENLKSVNNPTVLHIATHGVFLEDMENTPFSGSVQKEYFENPLLRSMLYLSGAAKTINQQRNNSDAEDGILSAYEAQSLDLAETELVVLSGCSTASGEIMCGEGVFGLQRAFRVAGAESIIMSLWPVNDKITKELMINFYDKWLSGASKRTAFRQAQLTIKEKYPEICHWGGFIISGK